MRILFLFLLILVQSFTVHAANIGDDTVNIGQKGSTADKLLIFKDANSSQMGVDHASGDLSWTGNNFSLGNGISGDKKFVFDIGLGANNPYFLYNSAKSKLGFSNDGTSIKDIGSGSGSGGGENFNNGFTAEDNANAEDGTSGWTASAGDFFVTSSVADWVTSTSYSIGDKVVESGIIYKANTAHTSGTFASDIANWDEITGADPLEGDASFVWIPAAQNDTLTSPVLDFNKDIFKGSSCQSLITYIGGDENLSLKVLNGDSEELDSTSLQAHGIASNESGFFICPTKTAIDADADKGNLRFRIENTGASAAAAIKFDKNYLGTLVGLSETTLPDVFSASFDGDSGAGISTITEDIPGAIVCSFVSTGIFDCSINGMGLTVPPVIQCTITNQATSVGNRNCTIRDKTTTSFRVNTVKADDAVVENRDFDVSIFKQGSDAKKSVQIYKSTPKLVHNQNSFSATISLTGVVLSEDFDWINGDCSKPSTGLYQCNLNDLGITQKMACDVSSARSNINQVTIYDLQNSTTSLVQVRTGQSIVASESDQPWTINCHKQESDAKAARTQNISLAGIAVNSYAEQSQNQVRVESCSITNNGTSAFNPDTPNCSSWIDSVTTNGTGRVDITPIAGVFKTGSSRFQASCTITRDGNFSAGGQTSLDITNTIITARTADSTGSAANNDFHIICVGEK